MEDALERLLEHASEADRARLVRQVLPAMDEVVRGERGMGNYERLIR